MSRAKHAREFAARRLVQRRLGRMRDGAVILAEHGRRQLLGRPIPGEQVPEVEVLAAPAWRAVAGQGAAGLLHAYGEQWWTTASLDEVTIFLQVLFRNLGGIEATGPISPSILPLRRLLSHTNAIPASAAGSELPDDALALVLDETRSASAALFPGPGTGLAGAQVAKFDRLCRLLGLSPADHVLEIGAGFGGFAVHAARHYGCKVTATSTPQRQELVAKRVEEEGLSDLVSVVDDDLRQLRGGYDKLVAIEAIDGRDYQAFFARCATLLERDGIMALQAVVVTDLRHERWQHSEDLARRLLSPKAALPSIHTLLEAASASGAFALVGLDDIARHYAETLRRWRGAFLERREDLRALGVDDKALRRFAFSLCYREAALLERKIGDVQCIFARERWRPTGLALPA